MRYVEAPAVYQREPNDRTIFLAGGITGCVNWQADTLNLLAAREVVIFNPRQKNFNISNQSAAGAQIAWEVAHLCQADVTLFWFPACDPRTTVQPIALFELGMALAESQCLGRCLAVGVDENYPRWFDVVEQCRHALPQLVVHGKLEDTVSAALAELDRMGR